MSLPDREPSVPVTLTPDAERITARVEGWIDASDNQHATPERKAVVRKDVRDRAERGQAKYPPWVTALTRRNPGREMREELTDATWYASALEDLIDYLFKRVDDQDAQIAHLTAEVERLRGESSREHLARECDDLRAALNDTAARLDVERLTNTDLEIARDEAKSERDTLRARIADLERERDRMLPVFEAAKAWHEGYVNALTEAEWRQERLALRDAVETATQEARHD